MSKWAVVACDQFTSEPEYWERVEKTVGDAPSTLRLILPEANLKAPNVDEFIADINASMSKYLEEGIFETLKDSLIYIERGQSDGKIRHGLIGMVDLDQYDFTPGSGALIRATEGTVLARIPPRARVRRNAPIELPHVMLLIDDPEKTVIEPLTAAADKMESVYDFDLMEDGGHIAGWLVDGKNADEVIALAFNKGVPIPKNYEEIREFELSAVSKSEAEKIHDGKIDDNPAIPAEKAPKKSEPSFAPSLVPSQNL